MVGKKIGLKIIFMGLFAVFILWSMPVVLAGFAKEDVASRLLQAMEQTGAKATTIEMRTSVDTGHESSTQAIDQKAAAWMQNIGITMQLAQAKTERDLYVQQVVTNVEGIQLHFRMIGVPQNGHFDTHVVFSLKGKDTQLPELKRVQKRIATAFREAGRVSQFSTCLRGLYSDKLGVDQQTGKILSIFAALHARELERLADDTVVSISGYTRLWQPHIKVNDQNMNLQVATHQDTATGQTWITVGTPIITVEY